jgi:hypothetical protein
MELPSLLANLREFVALHRAHGELDAKAGEPTPNGYRPEVACSPSQAFGPSAELFDPGMERRVELDVGRGSRTRASGQYERRTSMIVEIEGVDQIIRLLIALGERIEVEPLLDEFQHRGELEHRMSDTQAFLFQAVHEGIEIETGIDVAEVTPVDARAVSTRRR